jgi:hypothetical protein
VAGLNTDAQRNGPRGLLAGRAVGYGDGIMGDGHGDGTGSNSSRVNDNNSEPVGSVNVHGGGGTTGLAPRNHEVTYFLSCVNAMNFNSVVVNTLTRMKP